MIIETGGRAYVLGGLANQSHAVELEEDDGALFGVSVRPCAASVLRAITSCPNDLRNFCSTDVPIHPTAAPSILDYQ